MLAQAAWVGTQFLLAHEMPVHQEYRTRLINAVETDTRTGDVIAHFASGEAIVRESQASEGRNDSLGAQVGDRDLDVDEVLGPESGHRRRGYASIPRATRSRSCPQSLSEPLKVSEPLWPPVTENHFVLEFTRKSCSDRRTTLRPQRHPGKVSAIVTRCHAVPERRRLRGSTPTPSA